MKNLSTLLILLTVNIIFSQSGKIYPKDNLIIGVENTFIYEPSEKIEVPENIVANILIDRKTTSIPLTKHINKFHFTLEIPEKINVLFITISNGGNKIIDNNAEQGFVVYMKSTTEKEKLEAQLYYLSSCQMANYFLNLNINTENMIEKFDEIYAKDESLKQGETYINYLFIKYQKFPFETKPELVLQAEKLSRSDKEIDLVMASTFYAMMQMQPESDKISALATLKFPKGEMAQQKFMSKFYKTEPKTEAYILAVQKEFNEKFDNTTPQSNDAFYMMLIKVYLENEDVPKIEKYENLLSDNLMAASFYNNYAWGLSGQDLTSSGTSLDFAAIVSKKSLDIVEKAMEKNGSALLQGTHNMFADTYALILYKQKKFDLAFNYQDVVEKNGGLDTGGKERYAAIAEKAKGPEFAKNYIEPQMLAGVDSKIMINQLEEIYKTLNLPISEFENIKNQSLQLAMQKSQEEITEMLGATKAIDFELLNLKGKKVKLSDYKGKLIILDFWATWCGPCRSSFPNMQKLVTKYKNDDVEFFFINTWEREEDPLVLENVSKFIKENNYTFNVLFDFDDEIITKYKVQGIPTKIVIDKNGNIISINSSEDNIDALIKESIE